MTVYVAVKPSLAHLRASCSAARGADLRETAAEKTDDGRVRVGLELPVGARGRQTLHLCPQCEAAS